MGPELVPAPIFIYLFFYSQSHSCDRSPRSHHPRHLSVLKCTQSPCQVPARRARVRPAPRKMGAEQNACAMGLGT